MATNAQQLIKLAETLPPKLTRFLARYPPAAILPHTDSTSTSTTNTTSPKSSSTSPSTSAPPSSSSTPSRLQALLSTPPNPFKPYKNPLTGRWQDPIISLRRQADLVKLAQKHGVEELLPHSIKGTEERMRKRMEKGLRVKGTGVGMRVKGKESERTMKARLEKRRQAMLQMPQMIQTWKERGHGRGWKKWPK